MTTNTQSISLSLKNLGCLIAVVCGLFACAMAQASQHDENTAIESELEQFFDDYLAVYNRRFNNPEGSDIFRQQITALVHDPLLLSPPASKPQAPESMAVFARSFEAFVTQLEQRGVQRLQWHNTQLRVLTPNKVLANNIGHGIDKDGNVAYETISLYLVYRTDDGWKIAMFSPYSLDNALDIAGNG